ncbi:response regulator transcription factor [Nocardioides sp. GCM10027113]|uniref:response regulator transcription factor n=1 Tax=unclassified Nocardioides TaxID=2615069 RepID=UPI003608C497
MSSGSGPGERRALVIEDDQDIRDLLELALTSHGFDVVVADSGLAGLEAVRTVQPDLVTLDLGLPGIDGIEVCRRIREITDAYLIMVTGRDDEVDRLMGLETGADDYLVKPVSVRELRARVNAMFRRPRHAVREDHGGEPTANGHEVLVHGTLRIDVDGRRAFLDSTELDLTRTEFDLLTQLMRSPARVWPRETLLRNIWGTSWATDTHLVEVHMGNLRRKLGAGRHIRTVRGVGYRMETV